MKEKEEDEERNENICRQRTDNQVNKQSLNSKTEATLILCGSSGERANCTVTVIDWHFFKFFDYQCVLENTNRIAMFSTMFSDEKNLYIIIASISNVYCGT